MVFSLGWFDVYLSQGPRSLKEKRRIIKSLKDKIRARFNVSIAEVDNQDLWHRSTLGFALVCSSRKHAQTISDMLIEFIQGVKKVEIIDYDFMIENH